MTTNNGAPLATRASAADVDAVDTFAKQLYRRARNAGVDFADVATTVRGVHTVLKHLKVEVEDPGSLLNTDQSPVYARQLTPILEDCDFTLKQLATILEKYGANSSGSDEEGRNGGSDQNPLASRERDMIALIRTKLANQKLNIDMFLDTVQLHNPSKSHPVVETSSANLESIKDKVDAIAMRITQRRESSMSENDDELWLQFRDELEKDGFSKDVLRNNQDVLRAYIRQLDEQSVALGGKTPTVRGFLEEYKSSGDVPQVTPYPMGPEEHYSPKEVLPTADNEKSFPTMRAERLHPDHYPPYPSSLPKQTTELSYEPHSDDETDSNSMALVISTRDIMASDKKQADLTYAMDNMHLLPPPGYGPNYSHESNFSSSPHHRYLEAPPNAGLLTSPSLPPVDEYGLSPRFVPSFPPPPYGASPPPTLHSSSIPVPAVPGANPLGQSRPQRPARLAPDSHGRDIPLDAQWTRIKRSLISPVVLEEAGVRYEARPEFVAILGVFTKDQVAEFARRSAEVRRNRQEQLRRNRRDEKDRYNPGKYINHDVAQKTNEQNDYGRGRANSEFSSSSTDLCDSSDDDSYDDPPHQRSQGSSHPDDKSDGHDDEKGTKVYPFIVPPPEKDDNHSPSATVMPKPILKNKNDDPHVRFDPEPKVLSTASPRSVPRHAERSERRHRTGSERERHVPRSYDDREDRHRDRERDEHRRHHRHHDGSHRRDRDRDDQSRRRQRDDSRRDRDRDRYRDDTDRSEDRAVKKRVRGETLRAVGIGGAAASLLSVLTEAAAGF
ncbi:hypothetical protein BKA67DRAFT_531228 [Truncatella angustata]|uniref:DUF8035 domain-containing protein n=1 Tax=Truncatella angustata TaxID=152316 RepID=A0A9P9A4H5_9PEZI|nr:uncharacterized protein BKA67DRAFT_531228 [Truncatella angustata]KAH6661158.1 hypothetical protein BKA67DRAFT_531228 [Truncatella angustata]KAH8202489.1 hypothetical protein TruAng_003389 [Truncatella angustata]